MPRKKQLFFAFLLLCAGGLPLRAEVPAQPGTAQTAAAVSAAAARDTVLDEGLASFASARYADALNSFTRVLSSLPNQADRVEASYWTAMCYIGLGEKAAASQAIELFLASFPDSPRAADLLYQRGRLSYDAGNYGPALRDFSNFIEAAPGSGLVPSALYWGGECLYSLGKLEDADRVFAAVLEKYPQSVKCEAATYRRRLIGLEFREQELLNLLSLSHEESLSVAQTYKDREREYESALEDFKKADAQQNLDKATSAELRARVLELEKALAAAKAELASAQSAKESAAAESPAPADAETQAQESAASGTADLQSGDGGMAEASPDESKTAQTASAGAPTAPAQMGSEESALMAEALDAKARALNLLAYYLEQLDGASSTGQQSTAQPGGQQ